MKFLNWMGAEAGENEESLGIAVLTGLLLLVLAAECYGIALLISQLGVPQ